MVGVYHYIFLLIIIKLYFYLIAQSQNSFFQTCVNSLQFLGKNTDKGNIFCRIPTIIGIYLFSAMLLYNSKFSSQKLKQEVHPFHFLGIFAIYISNQGAKILPF